MIASVARATNMSGVSKSPWLAMLMRTPSPVLGAGPLGDDGADDRERHPDPQAAEDDRQGRRDLEAPRPLARRWRPGCASISSSSGSVERMPTMVAMAIGKKTISAQTRTRAGSPPPNQMSSSGASARIGTACAATM